MLGADKVEKTLVPKDLSPVPSPEIKTESLPPICNLPAGELVPIPTLSVLASPKMRFASVSPSTRKSLSAPESLNTNVPPSKLTFPVAESVVNAPVLAVVAPTVPLMFMDAVPVRFVTVPEEGVPSGPPL